MRRREGASESGLVRRLPGNLLASRHHRLGHLLDEGACFLARRIAVGSSSEWEDELAEREEPGEGDGGDGGLPVLLVYEEFDAGDLLVEQELAVELAHNLAVAAD